MSRRRFFSLGAKALVVAAVAPSIVDAAQALIQPRYGTLGGIERSTFAFWRNQAPLYPPLLVDVDDMRRVFNECVTAPPFNLPPVLVPISADYFKGLQALVDGDDA